MSGKVHYFDNGKTIIKAISTDDAELAHITVIVKPLLKLCQIWLK